MQAHFLILAMAMAIVKSQLRTSDRASNFTTCATILVGVLQAVYSTSTCCRAAASLSKVLHQGQVFVCSCFSEPSMGRDS